MKLGLFSDIHLEHREESEASDIMIRIMKGLEGCDVAVNAGDTHHDLQVQMAVARGAMKPLPVSKLPPYVVVGGNHDSYGWEFPVQDDVVIQHFGGLKFLSGTMWTNFDEDTDAERDATRCITDFRWIYGCTPSDMKGKFYHFLNEIETQKPDVVVSHFAPSPGSIVDRWKGNELNPYFCPHALERLNHRPRLWLHGHIHDPVDYEVSTPNACTRVVANPLGYPRETYSEVGDYSVKVIEI